MREEKKLITREYVERLNASPYFIVVNYEGLKVAQFEELRNRLARIYELASIHTAVPHSSIEGSAEPGALQAQPGLRQSRHGCFQVGLSGVELGQAENQRIGGLRRRADADITTPRVF